MNFLRKHLGIKLFLSYLLVILIGMAAIGIISRLTTPRAYERHMGPLGGRYQIAPMMAPGAPMPLGGGMMPDVYASFQASFNEALIWAILAAAGVAILVSLFLSRSIIAPLRAMMQASQRIAAGHYAERVDARSDDELGQLARRFNQMAEQLEHVESRRRRLIADVAHELRTPLSAITGSMEGLIDGVLPAGRETFEQIHAEADRLSRLVNDLQELSRVEARAYQLNLRAVDIAELVRTVTKRLGPQFEQKQVSLAVRIDGRAGSTELMEPLRVLADEDRMIQVLTNLAGNALQYTPEGGRVTISAKQIEGQARISVQDTGIGIPPEHLPLIFDRFYRVDRSRSRLQGGSGIGLTIARYLVEAHGGRIWAQSEGEGRGSVLHLTLPIPPTG